MHPMLSLVVLLGFTMGSDIGLVVSRDRHQFQIALATLPLTASVIILCLSIYKYRMRIRGVTDAADAAVASVGATTAVVARVRGEGYVIDTPDLLPVPAPMSSDATRQEVHYFAYSSVLLLATFLDMLRIFCGWFFGPSFSTCPCTLAGAFLVTIVVDYSFDAVHA